MDKFTETNDPKQQQDTLYDAGLKSLVRSLQVVFIFLIIMILGMLVRFLTLEGYFYVKQSQEAVIVLRFGKYVNTFDKGWHWFLPYPVHKFITFKTNRQTLKVNFIPAPVKQRGPAGQPPQGKPLKPGLDGYLITGDANIIHTEWVINYKIDNPKAYFENTSWPANPMDPDKIEAGDIPGTRGPQTLLRSLLYDAAIKVTASMKVDDILTRNKLIYKNKVLALLTKNIEKMNCGINIIELNLSNAAPPLSTKDAFTAVTNAGNAASALVDKAKEYRVQVENDVLTKVAQIHADATIYKTTVESQARADSVYFDSIYKEYKKNPETVLMALYNNTLSSVLDKIDQKYIMPTNSGGKQEVRIKINPEVIKEKNKNKVIN